RRARHTCPTRRSSDLRREDEAIAELFAQGMPMVLINRRSEDVPLPAVTGDDAYGVELAVRHLRELGHTAIAHVAGPGDMSTGVQDRRSTRLNSSHVKI